ncbi:MAG: hypothetical protein PVSMB9_03690 [Candidatus Dormibacteria bacterium]
MAGAVPTSRAPWTVELAVTAGSGRRYCAIPATSSNPSKTGRGRRSAVMALAPVERGADDRPRQFEDLSLMREAGELQLAKHELIVDRHFELPFTPTTQRNLGQDRRPGSRQLSRQTDGLIEVISGDAVFDRDSVFRFKHAPRLDQKRFRT